jgi:hypothetical protein
VNHHKMLASKDVVPELFEFLFDCINVVNFTIINALNS